MGGSKRNSSGNSGAKVNFLWVPGRKSRRHHKHNENNSSHHNYRQGDHRSSNAMHFNTLGSETMSGDSSSLTDVKFELRPATTPESVNGNVHQDKGVQSENFDATILVEPNHKEMNTFPTVVVRETEAFQESSVIENGMIAGHSGATDSNENHTDTQPDVALLNRMDDLVDGVPKINSSEKPRNEDDGVEKEECAVKCLYYTLQCCECTIL